AATGALAGLTVETRVRGEELGLREVRGAALELTAAADLAAQTVRLASLGLTAPMGRLQGGGTVALAPAAGTSRLALTIEELDGEELAAALALPATAAS